MENFILDTCGWSSVVLLLAEVTDYPLFVGYVHVADICPFVGLAGI